MMKDEKGIFLGDGHKKKDVREDILLISSGGADYLVR